MVAFRPALALVLLAGTWWASSAFIPSVFTQSRTPTESPDEHAAALRGTSGARAQEDGPGLVAMAPLGLAMLGLATMRRQQRIPAVSRHFFGATEPAPPKQAESYKDFVDPWLGAADLGFDPLNLAVGDVRTSAAAAVFNQGTAVVPETTYYNYRESEIKHGRFAMAAFLAIFFEEADRGALLQQLGVSGATDNLDATLGLDEVQAPVLLIGLGAQALAEYSKQSKEDDGSFLSVEYNRDRCPGDLGFDPLALGANNSLAQKVELHNAEVNLGRLAMIGVTSFLFKEFLVKDL
mmetsp:Transcript_103709/g.231584  ORF Transcript_103709/g.231584 Transcript_103709/m.231584 type:complete len:293 (+) Transcript_103709:63-941(+)